jgi:hypothetical protein
MSLEAKDDALELIRTHLPPYLTAELKDNLFTIVKENFPLSTDPKLIYQKLPDKTIYYQGDGLEDIPFSKFLSKEGGKFVHSYLPGIILSNTCDISSENERLEKPYFQFSSIFSLEEYIGQLKQKDISQDRIDSFIADLKRNRITNLFFLPEKRNGEEIILRDSFVRFDGNVSLPSNIFEEGDTYNADYQPEGVWILSLFNQTIYSLL